MTWGGYVVGKFQTAKQVSTAFKFPKDIFFEEGKLIMKKTLAAVAILGAFAGSALAADVTLYGRVNLGLNYTHVDQDGAADVDEWGLKSGDATGSRFGIKGEEQISEGLTVGFQLEHGFNADDGADADASKAFSRESRLYVKTDYGTLHMGRFGALDSATGSVDVTAGFTASGTGYGEIINDYGRVMKNYSRLDNSIAYTSPEFAGVKFHAMASLGQTGYEISDTGIWEERKGDEASHEVDRYYGLGVTGQWGALGAGLVVSQVDLGKLQGKVVDGSYYEDADDAVNVTASVNYDFGVTKVFLAAGYYDQGETSATMDYSQWGVSLSASTPIASGTLETAIGYGVGKNDLAAANTDDEVKVWNVGAYYKYPLSKRTYVYAGVGYDSEDEYGTKTKTTEVITGMAHYF